MVQVLERTRKRDHKQLAERGAWLFLTFPEAKHEGEALIQAHNGPAQWIDDPGSEPHKRVIYPDGTIYRSDELEAICQIWLALKLYEGGR